MDGNKSIKNYCNTCCGDTNHSVLFSASEREDFEYHQGEVFYMTIQCLGCEEISFRREVHDYDASYPDENDNWIYDIRINNYPSPLKYRKQFEHAYFLPPNIKTAFTESVNCIKAESFLLAGVGFRAVIEAICIEKNIEGRTLDKKIDKLVTNRIITELEGDRLHAVRFLGNDSVHEMSVPDEKALFVVLDIIENLLNNLYVIDMFVKPVLQTFLSEYDEFETLLLKKLKGFSAGDDFPLAKYLGKDVRRIKGTLTNFETQLVTDINNKKFVALAIGSVKPFGTDLSKSYQHFVKS